MLFINPKIDNSWTLFLDRDGVINKRIVDGYVLNRKQFKFLPEVLKAIKHLSEIFGRIVIVTNQQGVGKNLMTEDDLNDIHNFMIREIETAGGRIDSVYQCTNLEGTKGNLRKPDIGMGLLAEDEFPEINFRKSVMVGDNVTDMIFAERLGMKKVFIDHQNIPFDKSVRCDLICKSLFEFYEILKKNDFQFL